MAMISIKPTNVPAYLKDSALFANLSEDDEELSVPKECCKQDSSVVDDSDLEELLRTLRFWGMDQIPKTVVDFVLKNSRDVWEEVLQNYGQELSCVASLIHVMKNDSDRRVCEAVENDNLEIASCLLEHHYPATYTDQEEKVIRAVDIAARKGNWEIIMLLRLHNCPYHRDTSAAAAWTGNKTLLESLLQDNCPVAFELINYAFASGSLECLKYVHETVGRKWTDDLFKFVSSESSTVLQLNNVDEPMLLKCLEYALAHGCPQDVCASEMCAERGYLQLLKCLHEHGWYWNDCLPWRAAMCGNLPCLHYAMENGCPYSDDLISGAILGKSVEVIQYLYERGLPWPDDIFMTLSEDSDNDDDVPNFMIQVYQLGCPRAPDSCYYASKYGWFDLLVDAHQHGCEWDEGCTMQAARNGHLDCLVYLHENGCPWDEETAASALKCFLRDHMKQDCLNYVVEHGCPMNTKTAKRYEKYLHKGAIKL